MEHTLIILCELDIPPALSTARGLGNYRAITFDPVLLDLMQDSGLENVEYVDFEDCPAFPDLHNNSRELSLAVERELFAAIGEFLPGVSNFAWQHLVFYFFFNANHWYRALAAYLASNASRILGETMPTIFVNDNPSLFFWPSFVPSIAMLEVFQAKGIAFKAISYEERADESDVLPMLIKFDDDAAESWDILVHLPTCLHDESFLQSELAASGKSVVNLRPKYWDVSLPAEKDICLVRCETVIPRLPPALQAALATMTTRLTDRIGELLVPYISTDSYRQRQARHLVSLYRSQLLTYFLLHDFFADRKPRKMMLTDHDAGFHGPLTAYAEVAKIPVLLFPHSKTTADIQFSRTSVHCLTHPMQGEQINDADGQRVICHKIAFPEHMSVATGLPGPVKRIGLLLNSISLNGVLNSSHKPYMAGVRLIVDWCRKRNIELVVRGRHGFTLISMLAEATGIPAGTLREVMYMPLSSFVASQDLCLMYDAPTTAALEFLRNSVPILNPTPEPLAKYEAVIANTAIIPRGSVEQILFSLDSLVADPENLRIFRLGQFANYVNSFRDSHTLRVLL